MENAVFHFVFYMGARKGEAQVFDTARVSIGRASNCDFRVEAFQLDQVAPHHAELLLEDENRFVLFDLGTKSGTYVNGERVHERCVLMTEDYVRFGLEGPEVIFRIGPAVSGHQPLPQVFPVTAELQFFSGSDAGRIFPINAAVTSNVGRRADLEVPLDPRGDMIVSGNHCNIRYVNGHFVLTDTSRNGTYVNGDLVDQPMEILDGDVIMLGDGGPQARFHVDAAGRNYPNHRPLSPVSAAKDKGEPVSSLSAQQTGGEETANPAAEPGKKLPPSAPAVLASAKPFSSGSAIPPPPAMASAHAPEPPPADAALSPEAESINEEATAAEAEHFHLKDAALDGTPSTGAGDVGRGALGVADAAATGAGIAATGTSAAGSAAPVAGAASAAAAAAGLAGSAAAGVASVAAASTAASAGHKSAPDDVDEIPDSRPDKSGQHALSAVPKPVRTIKPGRVQLTPKMWIIIAAALVLLVIIAFAASRGGSDKSGGGAGGNYAAALKATTAVSNGPGKFSVEVPKDWQHLDRENGISIESPDKEIAVDYVRDGRISQAHVHHLLAKNGAQVGAPEHKQIGNTEAEIRKSSVGNVRRIAAILPAGGVPLLSMIEASDDALGKLSDRQVDDLLVKNVKVTGTPEGAVPTRAPAAPPTPVPQPTTPPAAPAPSTADAATSSQLPSPGAGQPAPPPADQTQDAAVATSGSMPAEAQKPENAASSSDSDELTTPAGPVVKSKALNLTLTAPTGWTAQSEEADEMIMMAEGTGFVVRVARDANDLDPDLTFKAMQEEGWTKDGVKKGGTYFAGEFSNKEQHLLLILVPEKKKSTLLIYATSPKKFSQNQREAVVQVLAQLLSAN